MTEPKAPNAADNRPTLLVVEPSRLIRQAVTGVCERRNVVVITANDAGEALTAIGAGKPTGVLTGFELRGLNGDSIVAALRCSPCHRAIPIGLLTSEESVDARLSTCVPDMVIHKTGDLAESVLRFLRKFHIGFEKSRVAPDQSQISLRGRILIAEDARMIHELLGKILHVAGAEVMVVGNGSEAVVAACGQPFDLILMDIEMPVMGGREATRQIREAGIQVPILAVSAHDVQRMAEELAADGFTGGLPKPVEREVLLLTCAKYLSPSRACA